MNEHSRTTNSARNVTMGLVSKLVSILLTFISRKVFLHFLSLSYLGINSLFIDVLSMLTLADLGFATAMAYSYYKPLAEQDEDKLAALTHFYRRVYNLIALVVGVLGLALTPFLHYIINLPDDIPHVELYYLVALANTVVSYLFVYKASIITANQKGYLISQYNVWFNVIRMLVQIVVLVTTQNYLLYCSISLVTTLANNLVVSRKANKLYPFLGQKKQLSKQDRAGIYKNLRSVFIYKVANVAITGTDNILISTLVGTVFVGMYSNYNTTSNNLAQFAFILFGSLTPSIGNLVAKETPERQLGVFRATQAVNFWVVGFFTFCLFFLMDDFIVLWLGAEYVLPYYTKIAILLNFYISLSLYPIFVYREATGLYMRIQYVMLGTAVLNIGLSIALGKLFGLTGILLATSIAKLSTYFWYEPKLLFKEYFHTGAGRYFIDYFANLGLLLGCILLFSLVPAIPTGNWLWWVVKACVCAAVINVVYFLRYFRTPEFKAIKGKAIGLLGRLRRGAPK